MVLTAKFKIGDLVKHQQHGYIAVVVDVDPVFQASGQYNPLIKKRDFATKNPWYRLLVDESSQMTYVEECKLLKVDWSQSIDNPDVKDFLNEQLGNYEPNKKSH